MADPNFDVVISGIGGIFPESDNLDELEQNLFNKLNLVTEDDRKWKPGELNVSAHLGKVKSSSTFDMTFFGIHRKLCEIMDPTTRLGLEQAYQAICDAGVNPAELDGSKTAVIMSSCTSETEYECVMGAKNVGHAMLGQSRTMQANRISYFLNVKGPSVSIDSSWIGGMQSLQIGYNMIKRGQATSVIVGTCSLISKPEVSTHYHAMGKLNYDGKTKCFSANADGYSRSEGCVVLFLQRAEFARRSYGTVLNVIAKNYGSRDVPFAEFSGECYQRMLQECYEGAKVDPKDVGFLEADGCASKTVDALELNAISNVLCDKRTEPLLIGCVKSNLGHTEASSSFVSLAKALIVLKTGMIPPNINYEEPNPNVPALISGKLQVVTEPTPLKGDIVGVSAIGVAGSYAHTLIKQNPKCKTRKLQPGELPPDGIPRLLLISGREEKALSGVLSKLEAAPIDEEFVALTHTIFKTEIKRHLFRAYSLLGVGTPPINQIKTFDGGVKRPLWFVFSGMGSQWPQMGSQLMKIPLFEKTIQRCHEVLKPKGVDLINIITTADENIFDNILHSFVGIAAIQIALVDILRAIGLEPDGMVGHSVGELGCAYADGCFTLEQMILSAYVRGRASIETELIKGKMAAVGKGYNQMKNEIPSTIEVACHNAADSCTLSGPDADMEKYIQQIKSQGVFAKLVNVANIAYHSRYVKPAAPALLKYMKEVVSEPKPRSSKWISSSVPEAQWDSDLAKTCSAEYLTNNLLSSVLFEEASAHIPKNAILIEIAPHGLLQAILKRSLSSCTNVPLTNRSSKDPVNFLLEALGKLYLEGVQMDVSKLYPPVELPVSRDTMHIAPIITWDHSEQWLIWNVINRQDLLTVPCWKYFNYTLADEKFENFSHNKIKNKTMIPSSSYLDLIIEMFNELRQDKPAPTIIENIKFLRYVDIPVKSEVELYFLLQKGSGEFEICRGDEPVSSGRINLIDDVSHLKADISDEVDESYMDLSQYELYKYMKHMGIDQGENFRSIQRVDFNENGLIATVQWTGKWVTFFDGLFNLVGFFETSKCNKLKLVNYVKEISIDFEMFPTDVTKDIKVVFDDTTKILRCPGLRILYPEVDTPDVVPQETELALQQLKFIPYSNPPVLNECEIISICTQIVFENINKQRDGGISHLNVIDIQGNGDFTNHIHFVLEHNINLEIFVRQCENDSTVSGFDWNDVNKECVWIISGCNTYKKTIKVLKSAKQGFLLTKSNDEILSQAAANNLQLIFEFTINNEKIYLYTLARLASSDNSIVLLSEANWKQNLLTNLNRELSKENPGYIYVVGVNKYICEIHDIIRECEAIGPSDVLRFYFVDDKAPSFKLDAPFYAAQVKKDMKVNININKVWGAIGLQSLQETQKEVVKELDQNVFRLASLKAQDIKLSAVGFNLEDITGYTHEVNMGVLEYTGTNKAGEQVFGLGTLDENNLLIPDKVLCWKKPKSLSVEDAISIPLYYSLACCVLEIDVIDIPRKSVLVHRGSLPVSQAIINLAIGKGFEVFTSYSSEEEKQTIKKLFPKLDDKHIISCENRNFDISILKLTKSEGVSIVVNTLNEAKLVQPSQRCLQKQSMYYQLSLGPMRNRHVFGMYLFLKENCVQGLLPENLLESNDHKKQLIVNALNQALAQGIVKPIKTKAVPSTELNSTVSTMLRSPENLLVKIYSPLETKQSITSKNTVFLCDPQKNYLILGGLQGIWLEMIEWLVHRGAKNIHVVLKQHVLTGYIAQRLNSILNNFPAVKVSFISSKRLSSTANIENLYNEINGALELATIFIVGIGLKDKITAIDQVLREKKSMCQIICIGDGGETVCERRRHNQLPALSINCRTDLEPDHIISKLDWLTSQSNNSPVIFIKEFNSQSNSVVHTRSMSYKNHIPATIKELIEFQKIRGEQAHFSEITTACPRHKYCKELPPIFLFSGLKPTQLKKLVSKLFYPTFQAVLPVELNSIEAIAATLREDMKRFNTNVFTLIADDWGGALALAVAQLLEADEKYVSLIFLDSAPQTINTWVTTILDAEGMKLITRYLKVNPKVKKTLNLLSNWDEMLEVALQNSPIDNDYIDEIRTGINMLKSRLNAIVNYTPSEVPLNGRCHLIRPDGSSESDQCGLNAFFKKSIKIHISDESSHQEILDHPETAKIINSNALFEYKDAANKPDEEKLGMNILCDAKYKTEGLVRA